MIETAKKTIGGYSFELSQLPAFTALPAFQRFLAVAGPMLPTLATVYKTMKGKRLTELGDEDAQKLIDAVTNNLPAALVRANPEEVLDLAKVLLEPCLVKVGKKLQRFNDVGDALLVGQLPVLLQLIGWAVTVHFGSFFPARGLVATEAPEKPAA